MKFIVLRGIFINFLLAFAILMPLNSEGAVNQAMIEPHVQPMPLLPFLDYIIDQNTGMEIEEVTRASGWQPFVPEKLPREEGIVWLRFTIAPLAPDVRPQTFLLDMGQSIPGTPELFTPYNNELSNQQEWRGTVPAQRNILLLPEASTEAINCYIRLDGFPGPWFAPMIRTPQNAAGNWDSLAQTGAILTLAVVMFLCLLRGVSEKGQWRYWTALFVGMALLQGLVGMPTVNDTFDFREIAAVLSPGLALMLMPHAARHLLQAKAYSRSIDIQLFLLALPGAVLAILPLIPGWMWLYRWLDLWPLAIIIYVATGLGAWMLAIPGARRFLLACIIPPLFVGIALLGLDFGLPANILASGPNWGVALAALLLAATRSPVTALEKAEPKKEKPKAQLPGLDITPDKQSETNQQEEIINLDHPLDDPNLRILPPQKVENPEEKPEPIAEKPELHKPAVEIAPLEERENALREPLDALLRDGAALANCSLPASARQYTENIMASAHKLAHILSNVEQTKPGEEKEEKIFNLQRILRNAHDSVAASAECAGIALSWYMPPHLGQTYHGNAKSLETTLTMLLESSVRSAHQGAIKVSVRKVPDSADPGHLLFTVTDDGNGYPPLDRSSLALVKAWELTGEYGGYLSVECSQHGATIAFTAHFMPAGEEVQASSHREEPYIILVSESAAIRRQLGRIIETLPCALNEAATAAEAIACQSQNTACLLITQGKFARPAAADLIRQIIRMAREAGVKCHALALTADESEWSLLKASGFTHAMLEPVDPEILKRTIRELTESYDDEKESDTPFYGEASLLAEEKKAEAPSMLIEQNFPVAPIFEGPDWLGNEVDEELEKDTPHSEQNVEHAEKKTPMPSMAPESAVEWVGEPMPIGTPLSSKKKTQESGTRPLPNEKIIVEETVKPDLSFAPDSAVEWVGEPTPIVKQDAAASEKPVEGELLDYIVGVNEKTDQEEQATTSGAGKSSSVREFMENSVNMVASTLSGLLRQQEDSKSTAKPEKKPGLNLEQEDLKSRSDPALIALLERIDTAMENANDAFEAKNAVAVAEATGQIARDAERFGLRLLSRMAKCVERAATASNMAAISDLLPELEIAVERNRITLAQRKQQEKN